MKDEIDRLRDDVFSSSASSERRRASLLSLNPFLLLGSFLYTSSCHISMCFSLRGPEEARILALGLLSDVRLPDRPCTLFLQRSEEPVPGRSCWFRAVPGAILKLSFLFFKSFPPLFQAHFRSLLEGDLNSGEASASILPYQPSFLFHPSSSPSDTSFARDVTEAVGLLGEGSGGVVTVLMPVASPLPSDQPEQEEPVVSWNYNLRNLMCILQMRASESNSSLSFQVAHFFFNESRLEEEEGERRDRSPSVLLSLPVSVDSEQVKFDLPSPACRLFHLSLLPSPKPESRAGMLSTARSASQTSWGLR